MAAKLTRGQVKKLALRLYATARRERRQAYHNNMMDILDGVKKMKAHLKAHPCKVTRIHAERWSSDEARHEVHFFIRGTQEYIAGFNPKYVEEFKIVELLRSMSFEID